MPLFTLRYEILRYSLNLNKSIFHLSGKSHANGSSSNTFEIRALQEEIERGREKAESQEVKLKQAAEFISHQEEQIGTLTGEIQDLTEQVQGGTRRCGVVI